MLNDLSLQGWGQISGIFDLLDQFDDIVGPIVPGDQSLSLGCVDLRVGLLWLNIGHGIKLRLDGL